MSFLSLGHLLCFRHTVVLLHDAVLCAMIGLGDTLIWDTDPQDPGILIHQEQEILIHQIKNEFGILIQGLKLAIAEGSFFSAGW